MMDTEIGRSIKINKRTINIEGNIQDTPVSEKDRTDNW